MIEQFKEPLLTTFLNREWMFSQAEVFRVSYKSIPKRMERIRLLFVFIFMNAHMGFKLIF